MHRVADVTKGFISRVGIDMRLPVNTPEEVEYVSEVRPVAIDQVHAVYVGVELEAARERGL